MIVGYINQVGTRLHDVRYDSYTSVMQGVEKFKEPFCWVSESADEKAFARIEALVRYYFLLKGSNQAIKDNIPSFTAHFPGACRDVAAAKGVVRRKPRSREGGVSLGSMRRP